MLNLQISLEWAYSARWPFEAPNFFLRKYRQVGEGGDNKMWARHMFLK